MAAAMTLSLDEVVRQHRVAKQDRPQELDANMRRLKAQHLKARGDDAIKQGNYRLAWERYSEAINLQPGKEGLPALYSNRSLAYFKAQRYGEALADAEAASSLAPAWHKAHWRRAAALAALKRAPEAADAFHAAWRAAAPEAQSEAESRLWGAVQRLTREQLGRGILALVAQLEGQGAVQAPRVEAVTEDELAEGMYVVLKEAHYRKPRPGVFYKRYLGWLKGGLSPAEAYQQRGAAHYRARCYLQSRADAASAVEALHEERRRQEGEGRGAASADALHAKRRQQGARRWDEAGWRLRLAAAYRLLGEACMAEAKHPDRDPRGATKAYLRAAELDPEHEAVHDKLSDASEDVSAAVMDQIQFEIYHEGGADGSGARSSRLQPPAALQRAAPGQRIFQAALSLGFPAAKAGDCGWKARELLRGAVAAAAGVDRLAVALERVLAPTAARPHLLVRLQVTVGAELLKASELVKAVNGGGLSPEPEAGGDAGSHGQPGSPTISSSGSESIASLDEEFDDYVDGGGAVGQQASTRAFDAAAAAEEAHCAQRREERRRQLVSILGGDAIVALLGVPDPALCSGEVQDVTPACAGASEAARAQQDAVNRGDVAVGPQEDRRLALPARPKTELELPYRMYRLVRADGSTVERADKHPFCMSRVYYDPCEKPEEVWAELADGSCRWRQTGGEVKVLALKVPSDLPPRQLGVDIQPYSLKVWNKASGEVYLEGALERGVVPQDCFWTSCGGEGEDGCAIYLRKMNLEVLQQHWMHNLMWWDRLFKQHGQIAWDDYEKDYSDLPEEVLEKHRLREAVQEKTRRVEDEEGKKRELLQEADDVRKRTRQERLHELRTGERLTWVELQRLQP